VTVPAGLASWPEKAQLQAKCDELDAAVRRWRVILTFAFVVCASCATIWWTIARTDPRLPFGIAALGFFGIYLIGANALRKQYKPFVVDVIHSLGKDLTYSVESALLKDHFLALDLYSERTEKWKSEDQICGRKNAVSFAIHECKATRTEGSGKHRRTVTTFQGLIIRLDFNKYFRGHTVVVPDKDRSLFFGEREQWNGTTIVRLENVEFEGVYSVYGTNQQEARYLLTPKLMELVLQARLKLGAIRLCFRENSLFVTIPQHSDRFEISLIGHRVTPDRVVGELMEVITFAEQLVDYLDLETRIWTRA
jgi:hypothetical protein